MPGTDPSTLNDESPRSTSSESLPLGPAPFDAAGYVAEARRRLPELVDELDGAADDDWEAVTCAIGWWLRDADWEPDWPVVFRALDLWDAALAHPAATDDVRIAAQVGPQVARVWDRRYGRAAAERATEGFRPHVDGTVARAMAREMLWTPAGPATHRAGERRRGGDGRE